MNKLNSLPLLLCVAFSFQIFAQSKVINSGWQFSENKTNWETINIPHTWNKLDAFDDASGYRRGLGYYKKQVFIASEEIEKVHYVKFNAVNQEATIFINGKEVGNHKGGYTAFNFNITKYLNYNTYNLIEVTVENTHNEDIPPLDADFTFYGGIYRDVELIALPKQHFSLDDFATDGFYINYPEVSADEARIEITAILNNAALRHKNVKLKFNLSNAQGNIVKSHTENLNLKSETTEVFKINLPEITDPKLWSPENPYLYKLKLVLQDNKGRILDTKTTNIGFRWVSVDPKKGFFLNGKPIKLIGVNRHQDYESYGNAVPLSLQKKDIKLIKDMGSNVIRFAHYPHARELYKHCDELGILVWTEIPIVNKVTNSEAFFETSITMQKEHIKQYYNYPSVVMMGYMNEIFLRLAFDKKESEAEKEERKKYTYQLAKLLEDLTRKEAPNHITVMALHFNELYNDTKIADLSMLVGWNLYFGWYHDTIKDLGVFLDDQHQRYPDRAIMISEYGPGADVNISTTTPLRYDYSQEYQLLLHSGYYHQVQEREFVTGMTAWNFADFGSEFRGETKPHVNQKGLVQYNREPKEVYYWYQSVLNNSPFIHIAKYQNELTLLENNTHDVVVFSNQHNGKIYVNGEFFKDLNFETGIAKIKIPFKEGDNTIKVVAGNQQDETVFNANIIQNLKTYPTNVLGINLGTHINYTDEVSGVTYLQDRSYSENLYGYMPNSGKCEKKRIPNNIKNSNLETVYQTILVDCSQYKVDVPDGEYKVTLYFVEPQLKSNVELVYNLNASNKSSEEIQEQRIFDIKLNGITIAKQFNMAETFPDKYGIQETAKIDIINNEGLTISLNSIDGETVISGILIEKMD
ncbi:glycoside hydrolase family 2 TIM barrel-domain containing protein [Winogradskyella bathintestinalis]|uniref:Glycoside hydrolase family 2 TIM barrel-domain containing protein n=1 Tax=Winogradskyella bathintestinalis TaxID=3035208 RepID=A0ABT7ZQ23_9FLAO|nr:glycoside hydrolase family 2 TIM barrel-domain containing protein [Winogradskyella bathintestinalis]MDN3491120.1 glycoside hydrolase family 2 TIM barrel-domain containing protein [Winogradskyella bathintestinalis]